MRGGRRVFRNTPHGRTEYDLEDEHIQDVTTRGRPKDGYKRGEDQNEAEPVVNVQNSHIAEGFA